MKKKKKASRGRSIFGLAVIGVLIITASIFTFITFTFGAVGQHKYVSVVGAIKLGIDLKGGVYNVMEVIPDEDMDNDTLVANIEGSMKIISDRLSAKGYTEATVQMQQSGGAYFIRVEVPDVDEPSELFDLIGKPAQLQFKSGDEVIIKGSNVKKAYASYDSDGKPCVQLELDEEGTKKFADFTTEAAGNNGTLDIVLDGETISSPTVSVAITNGKPQITGNYTWESATDFALQLQSGSLAVKFKDSEPGVISATLGENAIQAGLWAGVIGLVLVMIFMAVYYKGLGLAADISLIIYVLIVLFLMSQLPWVQLTLPGIAGVILGIGMAVDGNVIIFERIKDEYKIGKTPKAARLSGFRRASAAIWDANITTMIAAVVLWILGTGSIQGFAITLALSIVVSVFCSLVITRGITKLFYNIGNRNVKFYGLKRDPEVLEDVE